MFIKISYIETLYVVKFWSAAESFLYRKFFLYRDFLYQDLTVFSFL